MALLDANALGSDTVVQTRVCIAGAGPAGITLAMELAAAGVDVVLLEGGGLEFSQDSQALYEGRNSGDVPVPLSFCRSRYLGGASNAWAGWCRPLSPEDFEARDWIPESGWPFDLDTLMPYYVRARRTVEIGADEFEASGYLERIGAPSLGLPPDLVQWELYQFSTPTAFGTRYRDVLETSPRITTYFDATVVNIVLADNGSSVVAYECSTLDGNRFSVQADYFIVSMGGIENARILLASNSQAPDGIGNDNDLVGRYFMEHPHYMRQVIVALRSDVDTTAYTERVESLTFDADTPEGIPIRVRPGLALPEPLRRSERLVAMVATLNPLDSDDDRADIDPIGAERLRALMAGTPDDTQLLSLDIRAEQRPIPESRVTLTGDRDPLGVPRIDLAWRIADEDLADARRTLEIWSAAFARAGTGRVWMPADGERFNPDILSGCHHMGTTRMHDDPRFGVTDGDAKVHGVDNLYVAGSSLFPAVGFANPTLSIVALSHRLADHLAGIASG